jgi:hypothetical protein
MDRWYPGHGEQETVEQVKQLRPRQERGGPVHVVVVGEVVEAKAAVVDHVVAMRDRREDRAEVEGHGAEAPDRVQALGDGVEPGTGDEAPSFRSGAPQWPRG